MYGFVDDTVVTLFPGQPLFVLWLAQALLRLVVTLAALWLMTKHLFPAVFRALPMCSYFLLHTAWYAILLAALPLTWMGRRFRHITHSYCDITEDLLVAVHRRSNRARRLGRRIRLVRLSSLLWASVALIVIVPTFT